jgi:hypothetical protein
VKFVIADRRDYEFAKEIAARESLPAKVNAVLFSPCTASSIRSSCQNGSIADRLDVARAAAGSQVHLESRDAWV